MPVSVASIAETFLPVASGAARAMSNPGPGREFAALVWSMLGARVDGGSSESADAALPPPTEGTDGADDLAASLAGALVATQVAAPAVASPAIPTEADGPATGIGTNAAAPQGEVANSAIGVAQPLPPTEAGDPATAGTTAPDPTTPAPDQLPLPASQPLPPGNWAGYTDAADLPPWMRDIQDSDALRAIAEAALKSAMEARDGVERPEGHGKRPIEPPAGLDPGAAAFASVVRSAGNAENATTGDRRGDRHADQSLVGAIHQPGAAGSAATDATTDVAAPAAPATDPGVDLPPAVQRLEQAVIERAEQGGGEAHIRLDPPELGSVHIRVRIDGDHVHLHVEADRQAAATLLRDHTADLSALLGDRGLNLTDVYVGLGGGGSAGDARDDAPWQRGRPRTNDGEFAAILGIDTAPNTSTHNRLRSAYNPDGSHSYRV